jgi:hypothetical protein
MAMTAVPERNGRAAEDGISGKVPTGAGANQVLPADPKDPAGRGGAPEAEALEVRFADNSILKLTLREDKITFLTDYGKLVVPVADVLKIDFATRVPDDLTRKIEGAIGKLGSSDFQEREQAGKDLLKIGAKAYPALVLAAKSLDNEVRRRAEDLVAQVRDKLSPEMLIVRQHDVLHTKDSKITGRIEGATWKANTSQFGDVQVQLADVRSLQSAAYVDPDSGRLAAMPDPGTLSEYTGRFGARLAFRVRGAVNGTVYGTGQYTLDSSLATAAVHAGVLPAGQTGVVYVEICPSPANFTATNQNGVTSNNWGAYPAGAFSFISARAGARGVPVPGGFGGGALPRARGRGADPRGGDQQ